MASKPRTAPAASQRVSTRQALKTIVALFKLRVVSLLLLAAVGGAFLGAGGLPALGALLTGVFASRAVNAAGADGAIFGNPALLGVQGVAVAATVGYSFVVTLVILKVADVAAGLKVTEEEEETGLDQSQHGEAAYGF